MNIAIRIYLLAAGALVAGAASAFCLILALQAQSRQYEDLLNDAARQDAARQMQVTFKKQVQAWKDILIRGSDPAAFKKYSAEFHSLQSKVRELSGALKNGERDPRMQAIVGQFDAAHRALGINYAAGLAAFTQAKGLNMKEVDGLVKGQDRPPTDLIDEVVGRMGKRIAAARMAQQESVRRQIRDVTGGLLVQFAGIVASSVVVVRKLLETLRCSTVELSRGVHQVSAAADQLLGSSQALAQAAAEQASALEETSASSEEVHSVIRKNAEKSEAAAKHMTEAANRTVEANRSLGEMIASMDEITASSGRISEIIQVIDEIAFQTNILALNAAVEAARAGEAGMGFAVVADEVRNLAQRSAQAAKDTAALIGESISKSNAGKGRLDRVVADVRAIAGSTGKVRMLLDEWRRASLEQNRGMEQIARALSQIGQVSQSTSASAEQNSSASTKLSEQAEAIGQVVVRLRSLVAAGAA
jgi:methyl-accepting chemotaxis protein